MGKINKTIFKKEIDKGLRSRKVRDAVYRKANQKFRAEVAKLTLEYEQHPVTKEIRAGKNATNRSGTLGGHGNLFTFIGFDEKRGDPTAPVGQLILSSSQLFKSNPVIQKSSRGGTNFEFRCVIPSRDEISIVSRMPWESGRSWVFAIESGISGLSHYIYRKFIAGSRSSKAIQTKNKYITGIVYKPVSYMSTLLSKFRKRIRK